MGKKIVKRHWIAPFMRLHETLRPLNDAGHKLYHGVFLTRIGSAKDVSHIIKELEPSYQMMCQAPIETLSFRVADGVWAYHCFFASEERSVHALEMALVNLSRWLGRVPRSVLPKFEQPVLDSHASASLITWMGLLYYLAWKFDEPFLEAELEYSDSDTELGFNIWYRCSAYSLCDPTPLITLALPEGEAPDLWHPSRKRRGRGIPELVSAYLTTEVLAASMAVAPLLKYVTADPLPVASPEPSWKRRLPRKPRHKRVEDCDSGLLVLSLLWSRHCEPDKENGLKPYTQKEIIDELKKRLPPGMTMKELPQPTVSRRVAEVFPGGMRQYRELCHDGTITSHLEKARERASRERTGNSEYGFDRYQQKW